MAASLRPAFHRGKTSPSRTLALLDSHGSMITNPTARRVTSGWSAIRLSERSAGFHQDRDHVRHDRIVALVIRNRPRHLNSVFARLAKVIQPTDQFLTG